MCYGGRFVQGVCHGGSASQTRIHKKQYIIQEVQKFLSRFFACVGRSAHEAILAARFRNGLVDFCRHSPPILRAATRSSELRVQSEGFQNHLTLHYRTGNQSEGWRSRHLGPARHTPLDSISFSTEHAISSDEDAQTFNRKIYIQFSR